MKKRVLAFIPVCLFVLIFTYSDFKRNVSSETVSQTVVVSSPKSPKNETVQKIEELKTAKKYTEAFTVLESDKKHFEGNVYSEMKMGLQKEIREATISLAWQDIRNKSYSGAADELDKAKPYLDITNDTEFSRLYENTVSYQSLVPYSGPVEHIFFHQLIAYPELCFDGDREEKGFDDYYATVPEFKATIEQLYAKGYIMIDITSLYKTEADGRVVPAPLMLPVGKKPFVLSMDDYSFSENKKKNGVVGGFAFDKDDNIVTFTDRKGERTYSDDNEVVPIVDRFVREHPDFAFNGAKGIFAETGYSGVFGYPTNELASKDYHKNCEDATKLINRLRETGWSFASHSYWHRSPAKQSDAAFFADADRWEKEVTPLLGKTEVYIYPFGERIDYNSPKFKHLLGLGFKIICSVSGRNPYIKYMNDCVMMDRRDIDGISMSDNRLSNLLDVKTIIDPVRKWYKQRMERP